MALINCRECGKEISDTAERCTHCGCQTSHGRTSSQAKSVRITFIVSSIIFLIGFFLIFINAGTVADKFDNSKYWKYNDEAPIVLFQFAAGIGLVLSSCVLDVKCYKKSKEIKEAEKQQQLINRLVDQPHYHYHSSPPLADRPPMNYNDK